MDTEQSECLKKKKETDHTSRDAVDVKLEGFSNMISAHLRTLPQITRLHLQNDFLQKILKALQDESERYND